MSALISEMVVSLWGSPDPAVAAATGGAASPEFDGGSKSIPLSYSVRYAQLHKLTFFAFLVFPGSGRKNQDSHGRQGSGSGH